MEGSEIWLDVSLVIGGAILGAVLGPVAQSLLSRFTATRREIDIKIEPIQLRERISIKITNLGDAVEDNLQVQVKLTITTQNRPDVRRDVNTLSNEGIQVAWREIRQTVEGEGLADHWTRQDFGFTIDRLTPSDFVVVSYHLYNANMWRVSVVVNSEAGRWHEVWEHPPLKW